MNKDPEGGICLQGYATGVPFWNTKSKPRILVAYLRPRERQTCFVVFCWAHILGFTTPQVFLVDHGLRIERHCMQAKFDKEYNKKGIRRKGVGT